MIRTRSVIATLTVSLTAGTALAHPPWYTYQTVGPVPGYAGVMYPKSINDLGQVVGQVFHVGGNAKGFIWLPSAAYGYPAGPAILDNFGNPNSDASGINNAGQVSGSALQNGQWDVARWDLAASHVPTILVSQGYTTCISAGGVVGGNGYFGTPGGCTYAGIFPGAAPHAQVTNTECTNSRVMGLNSTGYAVGTGFMGSNKGFFASGPGYAASELVNFPGVTGMSFYTAANALNESGQIVGYVHHPTLGPVAIAFKDLNWNGIAEPAAEYTILSTPASGSCEAFAINNAGVVGGVRAGDGGGMLWAGGKEFPLNQCIRKNASGLPFVRGVADINESGQILAKASTVAGELAVVLTPTCYANCDGSTGFPVVTGADFICFMNAFAAGSPYANCDDSVAPPVVNANDFMCFLSAATSCP